MIPTGTRVEVVLDTPLSTRITKTGQPVSFKTVQPIALADALEIPPDTEITGTVVEAKRPGRFGRAGKLRVKVERIQLSSGTGAPLEARIASADGNGQGRIAADSNRTADLYSVGLWTLQGTLIGSQVKGGKGAAVGAGAGAAAGLILLMAQRGADVYLEPGMPFELVLEQDATLPGPEVYAAQQNYARSRVPAPIAGPDADPVSSPAALGSSDRVPESERPKLKRRPKNSGS